MNYIGGEQQIIAVPTNIPRRSRFNTTDSKSPQSLNNAPINKQALHGGRAM